MFGTQPFLPPRSWQAKKVKKKTLQERSLASTAHPPVPRGRKGRGECKSARSSNPPLGPWLAHRNRHDDLGPIRHLPHPIQFRPPSVIGPSEMTLSVFSTCRSVQATRAAANVLLLPPGHHPPQPQWRHSSDSRTPERPSSVWRLILAHRSVLSPIVSSAPVRSLGSRT
jgi:hypothetical protein